MRNDIGIGELFNQRYALDQILQRSYEWDVDRVINLINDIREVKFHSSRGGECKYNIGDFITYKNEELDDFKYLCDGQQRLTTLVLVFANILHHHPSDQKVKGGLEMLLNKSTLDSNGKEIKVKVLKLKNADNVILNKIIESGVDGLSKEEKKSHLVKVYNKITDVFTKNMSCDELNDFYTSIYKNASYFERECESQEEAIKQFNNLNGGQQTISKSRVGIATLYAIYNENHSNTEIERFLYELSNMDEKTSSNFLCLYIYYKSDISYYATKNGIPVGIRSLYKKDKNILTDMVYFYNNIFLKNFVNNKDPFIEKSSVQQIWIDLYTDKHPNIQDYTNNIDKDLAFKKCEWGYICNRIKNKGASDKNLYQGVIKKFNNTLNKSLSEYIVSYLKQKGIYEKVEIINEFKADTNDNKGGKDLFISLLLTIEKQYRKNRGVKEEYTPNDKVTLEHIHPKIPRKDNVNQCNNSITNRFGNLTIIGENANKSLSNKSFCEKRKDYETSAYYINREHLSKYEEWTDESVEDNKCFYFEQLNEYYELNL